MERFITAKEFLTENINKEVLLYFHNFNEYPQTEYNEVLDRWSDDSICSEKHRFDLIERLIPDARSKKILDMAAGCGSFVLQGLRDGWDTYGVEPEDWKHELIDIKFKENGYPAQWRDRIKKGIGEKLPFEDETFDAVDSWQTIEHVQNERDCIFELYRVLKKGGHAILRGPNYFCFFEGHYRMFWFPMMGDSRLAKFYLKIMKRPFGGLKTFHPVNPLKLRKYAREAGFKLVNIKRKQISDGAKRRFPFLNGFLGVVGLPVIYIGWETLQYIKNTAISGVPLEYLLIKE
jgi:2-polyprenyl-3-methyl-5-hydroxy-6-metoxy-1,4-benzoquinol methylase